MGRRVRRDRKVLKDRKVKPEPWDQTEKRVRSENLGLQGILEDPEIRGTRVLRVGTELLVIREREESMGCMENED